MVFPIKYKRHPHWTLCIVDTRNDSLKNQIFERDILFSKNRAPSLGGTEGLNRISNARRTDSMRFPQVEVVPGARQVGQPRSFNAGCNEIIFEKFCPHYYSFPFSRRKSSWWCDPIAFGVLLRTPPPLSTAAPHGLSHIAHKNLVGVEAAIYSCSSDRARARRHFQQLPS